MCIEFRLLGDYDSVVVKRFGKRGSNASEKLEYSSSGKRWCHQMIMYGDGNYRKGQ
jgi:hypothetical protein